LGKWCGGTGLMIALDWKGNIYPCIRYAENSICGKQEPYLIGNIKDGIGIRPEDLKRIECMNCIDRRTQCTDECFYCPIASGCGECSAYNYEIFGTPDKKATFICIMHKARVLAISYFWNSRHKKDPNIPVYALTIPKDWALEIIPEEEFEMLEKLSKG
jgi:radical SAM protein with 4Fe4S-binding SPASM domain